MSETSQTHALTTLQAAKLRSILEERGWTLGIKEYALFHAQKDKTHVTVYQKGPKVLVQGKGTLEFIEFILEPEILGQAKQGYEEIHDPEMYAPHFGIDESGKGDFYGPLVIAGVYTNGPIAHHLKKAGIQDSKAISSDSRIRALSDIIRETPGIIYDVVSIGPERYNQIYIKARSLNRLLAWGHSRVIENLLEKQPDCPRALSDQFADKSVLESALLENGKRIQLDQRTKGESDIAVAAASILARERFIDWMDDAGKRLEVKFPRGAGSAEVQKLGKKLVLERGQDFLPKIGKMHFRNSYRILGLPEPARPDASKFRRPK